MTDTEVTEAVTPEEYREASELASAICGCATKVQHCKDVAAILAYRRKHSIAHPAPDADLVEALQALDTVRDYVADAASGALIYVDSGAGFLAMAKEDLARIDAARAALRVRGIQAET